MHFFNTIIGAWHTGVGKSWTRWAVRPTKYESSEWQLTKAFQFRVTIDDFVSASAGLIPHCAKPFQKIDETEEWQM